MWIRYTPNVHLAAFPDQRGMEKSAEENAASTEETLACATEANAIIRKIGKEAQNVNSIAIDLKKNIDTIKI